MKFFDWENKISMDPCALLTKERENESIHDYRTYNFYQDGDCEESARRVQEFAMEYPNLRFRNGYGVASSCTIDDDSKLRYSSEVTHGPERRQYQTRSFQAVPAFNRGSCAPNTESFLINGLDTTPLRQCDRLAERNFDRFIPLLSCVEKHIEASALALPKTHTIGENSRDMVRNMRMQSKC